MFLCLFHFVFFFSEPAIPEALTTAEVAGLVVGLLLAALIAICLIVWCYRERQRQMKARGRVSGYGVNHRIHLYLFLMFSIV